MVRIRRGLYVAAFAFPVALGALLALEYRFPIGPVLLVLGGFPVAGLLLARRRLSEAVPDMLFGAIDTGLLTIPALWGGVLFGVAGAIAGGVVGDALTDAIAGFFEGSMAEWLERRGIHASREAVTTALGKMAGCLCGSGLVLTLAMPLGLQPGFSA